MIYFSLRYFILQKGTQSILKTLFVSDLDGTLLDKSAILSDYSIKMINSLIEQGMCFTVATARSPWSVQKILAPLRLNYPCVLMNGVCVYDLKKQKFLKQKALIPKY